MRRPRDTVWLPLCATLLMAVAVPAIADGSRDTQPGVTWEQLSPDQQKALGAVSRPWDDLPPRATTVADAWRRALGVDDARAARPGEAAHGALAEHDARRAAARARPRGAFQAGCRPRSRHGCARSSAVIVIFRPSSARRLARSARGRPEGRGDEDAVRVDDERGREREQRDTRGNERDRAGARERREGRDR